MSKLKKKEKKKEDYRSYKQGVHAFDDRQFRHTHRVREKPIDVGAERTLQRALETA